MAAPLELHTARLDLTRLTRAHLDDLVRLDADPEVMRYINGGLPNSRATYEALLLPRMLAHADAPYGFLAAYAGGRFVGWFHLRPSVADPALLELGYRLQRDVWGRGLATEGGRALVDYAFDVLEQPAVDACADPRNRASTRVMEKCGMRRIGAFVHPSAGVEVVRYMVEKTDRRALTA